MNTFEDFVQCKVTTPLNSTADSFAITSSGAPYRLPPLTGGILIICDSPGNPSKIEMIKYTSRTGNALYGVTRGYGGTTAQNWTGNTYCYQSLTALDANFLISEVSTLGTAAKLNAGTAIGNLPVVGTGGLLSGVAKNNTNVDNYAVGYEYSNDGTDAECVARNLPSLNSATTDSRYWIVKTAGEVSRTVQVATEVYGIGTTRGRTFTRVKHDSTWYPWVEVMRAGAYGLGEQSLATLPATQLGWNTFFNMNVVAINSSGPFASFLGISQNSAYILNNEGNGTTLNEELFHTGNILQALGQSILYPMTQKAVTDALNNKVDKVVAVTGSITLNGTTDNTVAMTNIIPELALEIGDVIRIDTGAYNKLHTVESITDNSSIIVNYEHAGNRGNGSLKLPDATDQATVTRIAKWFNAPLGLGQAWVSVKGLRLVDTTYTGPYERAIQVGASGYVTGNNNGDMRAFVNGVEFGYNETGSGTGRKQRDFFFTVSGGEEYSFAAYAATEAWAEKR